jgi:hypothetical protein
LLNGPVIPIRPKPRDFFGVSRAALKSIGEYVDKWISAALK